MLAENRKSIQILIVDDESFVLNFTKRLLKKLGYFEIDTALDGNIALGKLVSKLVPDYDLIICDLNMPKMDGLEFMRHAHEANFQGELILLSGEDKRMLETALSLAKAHQLNILGAISKPLKSAQLEEIMGKHCLTKETNNYSPQDSITKEELQEGIYSLGGNKQLLVYQPKVEIRTGEITGVECLARWKHPQRGLLGPGAFIPLAEETGLIDDLTKLIYAEAAQKNKEWESEGKNIRTSINFSVSSFTDPTFSQFVTETVADLNMDPARLILEVTETQVMSSYIKSLEIMMRLRLKKFGLSIDDFGTGNSSMEQLKNIPFTEMKIDRAFVNDVENNSGARAILETSVDLGKRMEMTIVAEGAETREDWNLVEELGCDYVQGYYCAKPMLEEDFGTFLENWAGPH